VVVEVGGALVFVAVGGGDGFGVVVIGGGVGWQRLRRGRGGSLVAEDAAGERRVGGRDRRLRRVAALGGRRRRGVEADRDSELVDRRPGRLTSLLAGTIFTPIDVKTALFLETGNERRHR